MELANSLSPTNTFPGALALQQLGLFPIEVRQRQTAAEIRQTEVDRDLARQ